MRVLFFFNDPSPPEIYTLSLHDALPILTGTMRPWKPAARRFATTAPPTLNGSRDAPITATLPGSRNGASDPRSEEHTSELQSLTNLVCRLLLEKKKKKNTQNE